MAPKWAKTSHLRNITVLLCDGTLLNTLINTCTRQICHLKIVSASQAPIWFLLWLLVYMSDNGPKNGPKLVTLEL